MNNYQCECVIGCIIINSKESGKYHTYNEHNNSMHFNGDNDAMIINHVWSEMLTNPNNINSSGLTIEPLMVYGDYMIVNVRKSTKIHKIFKVDVLLK